MFLQLLFGDGIDAAEFTLTPKRFLADCAEADCSRCDRLKVKVTAASIVAILIFAFMIISPFFDSGVRNGLRSPTGGAYYRRRITVSQWLIVVSFKLAGYDECPAPAKRGDGDATSLHVPSCWCGQQRHAVL